MSNPSKHYSNEFRKEAVELALEVGFPKAGRDLGVHHDNIRRWAKKEKTGEASTDPNESLESEVKRLRKEVGYLRKVNDVLKKSTAVFSNDQIGHFK